MLIMFFADKVLTKNMNFINVHYYFSTNILLGVIDMADPSY